ncbi:MAG TPA: response regulator [Xanthobacteraceae bacterium]|jgi:CheY-like chemotaxis protein
MHTPLGEYPPLRVLLVEDEYLISEWVSESLEEQGFAVRAVSNAADALRLLDSTPIDVMFTDINLTGGVDGLALAHRARELYPDLPIVYASGRINVLDAELQVPGAVFVAKPYAPEMVGRILADAAKAGHRLHA